MSDLLVIAPLRIEALAIRSGARSLRVHKTGMGPHRARLAAARVREDPAAALLVVGFGGGLSQESELGEAIVAEEVAALDGEGRRVGASVSCAGVEVLLEALAEHGLAVRCGPVASVDRIVTGDGRERMLSSGALAVDMESAWLAGAACGRPFAVVRIISDTPIRELRRRLPVGPPLPTLADGLRATAALRRAASALGRLMAERDVHTVFGPAGQRVG